MNRKDYKKIAKIIKRYRDIRYLLSKKDFVNKLADYFKEESENREMTIVAPQRCKDVFNRKQFLIDCGITK